MTHAYDYRAQCWLEGEEGTRLEIQQLQEELGILQSKRGPEYLKRMAKKDEPVPTIPQAIKKVLDRLIYLGGDEHDWHNEAERRIRG